MITQRQQLATAAMQALISLQHRNDKGQIQQVWWIGTDTDRQRLAIQAWKMADAMLETEAMSSHV